MKEATNKAVAIIPPAGQGGGVPPHQLLAALPEDTTQLFCAVCSEEGVLLLEEALAARAAGAAYRVYAVLPHEEVAVGWDEPLRDRFFAAVEASDRELLLRTSPDVAGDGAVLTEYLAPRCGCIANGLAVS